MVRRHVLLIAALATGWAVLAGHRAWLPAVVCTASVATQAHLLFALPSVALAAVGLTVGLADSVLARSGCRWAWIGLASGVACWSAPLWQQFTGAAGNLTALLHGQAATGHRTGLGFGLRALDAAAGVPPVWRTPLESLLNIKVLGSHSAVAGVIVLAVTVAAMAAAIRPLRSRPVAALAGVSLVASAGAAVTYASISLGGIPAAPRPLNTLNYLMIVLLPVGLVCWLVVTASLALVGKWAIATLSGRITSRRAHHYERARSGSSRWPRALTRAFAMLAVVGLAAVTSAETSGSASEFLAVADAGYVHVVAAADRQITHRLSAQPIVLTISTPGMRYHDRRLLLGLVWLLATEGYSPRISQFGSELGPSYVVRPGARMTGVQVNVRPDGVTIAVEPWHSVRPPAL